MTEPRKHILLVDDEDILRMGIRDRLEANGYEIDSVASGEEAIASVQEKSFDLIILDLLMPRTNGFEVFQRLQELSVVSRTPVLVLTVVGLEPQVQELLREGAHYLQKDGMSAQLVPKVKELIG